MSTPTNGSPATFDLRREQRISTPSICSATASSKPCWSSACCREKLWAYPASFAVFGAFIAYQLYRYSWTHDVGAHRPLIFDLFVIALAVHEYRLLRKHLPTH